MLPPYCQYDPPLERAIVDVEDLLQGEYRLSRRAVAVLLLQGDAEVEEMVRQTEGARWSDISDAVERARDEAVEPMDAAFALARRDAVRRILRPVMTHPDHARIALNERISRICTSPVTGIPILLLVLWFGLYQFVGVFGGGTLVKLLEDDLFQAHVNPWVVNHVNALLPWAWLSDLFVGPYGIWTLGVTYAIALIFPIVGTFFLAFSVLEDSGYFPRLAMLIDRVFKSIGLNGKAVIPIVLGFGCDTMATIVTRILETRRERILVTFLLSLAIPCSAQIGVMTALLSGHPTAFLLWAAIMLGIFLIVGYAAAKVLPGEPARFAIELPPLRWPSPANILMKTYARMQWYFLEVFPLFVVASFFIWLGRLTGLFDLAVRALAPLTHLLGLPSQAAEAFLFGFFRRDYGAAGLYRLEDAGLLSGNQLLVSVLTLTIFLPCIAQFLIVKKERGAKAALAMAGFILPFALLVGSLLNLTLRVLRIHL